MSEYYYVPLQREGIHAEAEINQAINDLVSRGYELVFGPQCFTRNGKKYIAAENRRVAFEENVQSNMWRAKMRKEKRVKGNVRSTDDRKSRKVSF